MAYPLNRGDERRENFVRGRRVDILRKLPPTRSLKDAGYIKHIILVRDDANPLWRICSERIKFLHEPTKHRWRNGLFRNRQNMSTSRMHDWEY